MRASSSNSHPSRFNSLAVSLAPEWHLPLAFRLAVLVVALLGVAACSRTDMAGPSAAPQGEAGSGVATDSGANWSRRIEPISGKWANECKNQDFKLVLRVEPRTQLPPRVMVTALDVPVVDAWVIHEPTTGPWLVLYFPAVLTFDIWPPEPGAYRLIAWREDRCASIAWKWPR